DAERSHRPGVCRPSPFLRTVCPDKQPGKYGCKNSPVTENGAARQKERSTFALSRVWNLLQRTDDEETEKQGEHHIQTGISKLPSFCKSKAERNLRQQCKYKEPERVLFSGMGIMPAFH